MSHNRSQSSGSFIQQNFLGVIGCVIIIGTVAFIINQEMRLKSDKMSSPISPSSNISPTPLPPTPSITLSDLSFEVLNGSGIEGQAGKVADLLKEKNVTKITTDNADNYNYVKTIIRIKKEYESLKPEIESLIKSKFEIDTTEVLDSGSPIGVQIVVGT